MFYKIAQDVKKKTKGHRRKYIIIHPGIKQIKVRLTGSSLNSKERLKTNIQTLHLFLVSTMHSNCQQVTACLM